MKFLKQSAADLLLSLKQHRVNVKFTQLKNELMMQLNDATNQRDSIEQFKEKHETVVAEMEKKVVEDSIEQFKEKHETVVAEMEKKVVEDTMKILRESAADFRQSLQHPENVMFRQLNLNYATNQRVFQVPQPLSTGSSDSPIDISFVVDASCSIEATAFNDCLRFIIDVIDNFKISSNAVRVSLVTYGYEAYEEHAFGFTSYLDKNRLKRAIRAVPYIGGSTNTSEGIRYMLQNHYPESRSEAHHVAIVITDGKSNNMQETAAAASKAQRAYNQVFAIRVGSSFSTSLEELFKIASDRSYVLHMDSDVLQTIKTILTWKPYKDSTKQLEANRGNGVTEMEGSIEHLQERYKKLVTELRKKGNYLEEVKIIGQDTMRWLDEKTERLDSGLKYIACDIGTVDNLCRTTDELVIRLEDIAKEISGKIASMSSKTDNLQENLKEVRDELENDQRHARSIGTGIAVAGAAGAVVTAVAAVATVLTGGLAAPLTVPLAVFSVGSAAVGTGSLAISQVAAKYMEREAFKEAQTHWNGYGRELKGSGLLWIIGQEMINQGQRNIHIVNAGKAFKEMHKDDASSKLIALKYFKDRMVAKFIFSGLDFMELLKWLLSSTDSIEIHLNSFINTELVGIQQALKNMATDIDRN